MTREAEYISDMLSDLDRLDGFQRVVVCRTVTRVSTNPVPQGMGSYGNPLGNRGGENRMGLLKTKLCGSGPRIVYGLGHSEGKTAVVVVGVRADEEVYRIAVHRIG